MLMPWPRVALSQRRSLTSFHSLRVGNAGGRLVWNVRTWPAMLREKAQAAPTARPKVLMRRRGADCLVVVRHRLRRPAANETLVSHCRLVGIELRRRVCFFVVLKRVMPVERRGWVIAFEIGSTGNG